MRQLTYANIEASLRDSLGDLSILAGDVVGPSDSCWQDVASTAALNLRELARLIEAARSGRGGMQVFPSPREVLEQFQPASGSELT